MSRQSRFDARYWMLGAGALGQPRGVVRGGRREEGSGWGTRVYLWWIHVDIWQNQYNIVKLKNTIKKNKIEAKKKNKNMIKKIINEKNTESRNQEYYIQQNYPFKKEERLSQTKNEEVYHHWIRPI